MNYKWADQPKYNCHVIVKRMESSETDVILGQVGMIGLNAVIEDGYDNSFSGIALLPCGKHVHVVRVDTWISTVLS